MADRALPAQALGRWGPHILPGAPWMRTTFLLLLAAAAVLRLWQLGEMPFSHDELSALSRLHPTLLETVRRGVMEQDTHPPGVQVFLWGWTNLFGTGALAVKLPFVLMGLAALWWVYRTAMAWTDAPVALLVVALLAVLQYGVLYGQLARPYAAGLFTTALCADQLTRWLAFGRPRQLLGWGAGLVLSAYTHHFALLLGTIITVTAFFLITPERRRSYLLLLLVCAVIALPNLPILLHQLGLGGLGWLAPPDRYWLLDHLRWVAHTSTLLATLLLALLAVSLARGWGRRVPLPGAVPVLLLWGLLPLIIGLAYSIFRAPVLQHSVLLFSFPYLAMGLLAGLAGLGRRATHCMVGAVAVVGTATLITVRQHFAMAYASNYRSMVQVARQEIAAQAGTVAWFHAQDEQLDLLLAAEAPGLPHIRLRHITSLDSLLRATTAPRLVLGEANGAPPELTARIEVHFPHLVRRIDLPEGRVSVLERGAEAPQESRSLATAHPRGTTGGAWSIADHLPVDTLQEVWDMTGHEFGLLCELVLDTVVTISTDQLEVHLHLDPPPAGTELGLVVELVRDSTTVFYRTAELGRDRIDAPNGRTTLTVAARRGYAPHRGRPVRMRTYVHNRSRGPVHVRGMEVSLRPGNPVLQGVTGPIIGPWVHRP
jgi:hypothetical protein